MGGLVDSPAPTGGGMYHTMSLGGGPSTTPDGQLSVTSTQSHLGGQSVNSHLDSFFAGSGWTREDVLVVAAMVQLVAWGALLYLEVS